MLKMEYFKYAVVLAQSRSISKAAEKLFISQPYLSAEIKKLEHSLGVELFMRSRSGIVLTEPGKKFLTIAEQIYTLEQEALQLGRTAPDRSRALSVSSIYSFTMLELFRRFSSARPDTTPLNYAYDEMPNQDIPGHVQSGASEVGLAYLLSTTEERQLTEFAKRGLQFTPLCREPLFLVVSSLHPLADRTGVTFQDLLDYPLIVEKIKSRSTEAAFEDNLLFPELFTRNIRMPMLFDNSRSLMFYLSRSNTCFWVGQRSLNLESPFYLSGELNYIPITDAPVTLTTGYLTVESPFPGSAAAEFIALLEDYFADSAV